MSTISVKNTKIRSYDFNTSIYVNTTENTFKTFPLEKINTSKLEISDFEMIIYLIFLILFILVGFIVNLIVILTYKFGDRNNLKNHRNLLSISHNGPRGVNSLKTTDLVNSCGHLALSTNEKTKYNRSRQFSKNNCNERRLTIAIGNQTVDHSKEIRKNLLNNDYNKGSVFSTLSNYGRFSFNGNRIRRTLSSYFILILGCCDFFICLFNISFILILQSGFLDQLFIKMNLNSSSSSDLFCKFIYFFIQIPISLEIEILLTIAIDRYFSVFRPIKLYYFDRKKLKTILIFLIVSSTLICTPNILFYTSTSLSTGDLIKQDKNNVSMYEKNIYNNKIYSLSNYCVVQEKNTKFFNYYQLILFSLFFANLIIISVCYLKVYTHVYKASVNQRRETISSIYNNSNNIHNNSKFGSNKFNSSKNSSNSLNRKIELTEINSFTGITIGQTEDVNNNKNLNNKIEKFTLSEVEESDEFIGNEADKAEAIGDDLDSNNSIKTKSNKSLSKLKLNGEIDLNRITSNLEFEENTAKIQTSKNKTINHRSSIFIIPKRSRFLSESHVHHSLIKQHSFQSDNGSNRSNSLNEFNRMTIRRHTSRKFKHGKTARVLGIATFVLALTWSPYWFSMLMIIFKNEKKDMKLFTSQIWELFLKNSFYLNYIINPIIYSFVDQRFRKNVICLFKQAYLFLVKRNDENLDGEFFPYRSVNNCNLLVQNNSYLKNSIVNINNRKENLDYLISSKKLKKAYCSFKQDSI